MPTAPSQTGGGPRRFESRDKFTLEEIAALNARVALPPNAPGNPEFAPGRTLWYAQYDIENMT